MRKIWAFLWQKNFEKFEKKIDKIGLGSFKTSKVSISNGSTE